MMSSMICAVCLGAVMQLPGPKRPLPIALNPRIFLVSAGRPTLQVWLPALPGAKPNANAPLAAPASPFQVNVSLDENSISWLRSLNNAPTFEGMLARCDSAGRVLEGYNLSRTRPNLIGFPRISATTGGVAMIQLTLSPSAVTVNKTAPPIAAPRSVSAYRLTGFGLKVKDKPVSNVQGVWPFELSLAATEYSGRMSFDVVGTGNPGAMSVGAGEMELRGTVMARQVNLVLKMKSLTLTPAGGGRMSARAGGITFQ